MKLILIATAFLALSSCATSLTQESMKIVQTNQPSDVKGCKTLGEVKGHSSYGGLMMQEAGKNYAKNEAVNNASAMGATHILWTLAEGGFFGGNATGVAYNCKK